MEAWHDKLLLTYGADVNIMDHGKTVAHTAAELNDTLLILILRRHEVDFSIKIEEGETPLMLAIALNNKEAIRYSILQKNTNAIFFFNI